MQPSRTKSRFCLILLCLSACAAPLYCKQPKQIAPHIPWSASTFAEAARDHKFVVLSLEDFGCRECRSMESDTYSDDIVRRVLDKRYVRVRVDVNSRPDLANRYRDYQLPTTVIFNNNGSEIIRQQGYIPPRRMASLLQAVIDDPSPGPSVKPEPSFQLASDPAIAPAVLKDLKKSFNSQYDIPAQGWAFAVQYIDRDLVDYGDSVAAEGGRVNERYLRNGLDLGRQLLDPAWGGTFQSLVVPSRGGERDGAAHFVRIQIAGRLDSTGESWDVPHFERALSTQTEAIDIYLAAYSRWHDPEYLKTALNISVYVHGHLLSPNGTFYVGQAGSVDGIDDSVGYFKQANDGRLKMGVPVIDTNVYARENGWMIESLCGLYKVTHDASFLMEAQHAAQWVIAHRSLPGGGFAHGEHDDGGPYLSDALSMGRAFLALYEVTHNSVWLTKAAAASIFISTSFKNGAKPGFVASSTATDVAYGPHPSRSENAKLVEFTAELFKYTGDRREIEVATNAMKFLATKEIAAADFPAPVLLAKDRFEQLQASGKTLTAVK